MLIKTSNYYNINPGLIINLGLLDYQQSSEYQQDRTNPHIINHILNYQSSIFNKNRNKAQYIVLPKDLQFIRNIDIDWFMFRSRYNRIQGLMRTLLFDVNASIEVLATFNALVFRLQRSSNNFYINS
jgi:hypothetical protein